MNTVIISLYFSLQINSIKHQQIKPNQSMFLIELVVWLCCLMNWFGCVGGSRLLAPLHLPQRQSSPTEPLVLSLIPPQHELTKQNKVSFCSFIAVGERELRYLTCLSSFIVQSIGFCFVLSLWRSPWLASQPITPPKRESKTNFIHNSGRAASLTPPFHSNLLIFQIQRFSFSFRARSPSSLQ